MPSATVKRERETGQAKQAKQEQSRAKQGQSKGKQSKGRAKQSKAKQGQSKGKLKTENTKTEKLLSLEGGLVERVGLIVVWLVEERTEHFES